MAISVLYEKFGLYQILLFIYAFIACTFAPLPIFLHLFISENYNYRCFVPGCDGDASTYREPWLNFSIPSSGNNQFDRCKRFGSYQSTNSCLVSSFNANQTEKCSKYVFEAFYESLARKFDLLCEKQWIWDTTESVFMVGVILGALLVGVLSDRYGRKKAFFVYSFTCFVFSLINSFAFNFYVFISINFFIGCFSLLGAPVSTLCLESLGPKYRTAAGIGIGISYAIGELCLALFAYLYPQWQSISFFVTFAMLVLVFISLIMPESIPWLSSKCKKQALDAEILKLVKMNKLSIPNMQDEESSNIDVSQKPKEKEFGNPLILFKTPYLRKCTVLQMVIWFCVSFVYLGASLGSKHLGSNYLMTFVFLALPEIPSNVIAGFALMKFGRKSIQIIASVICGIVFLISAFLSDDYIALTTGLAVIGKASISVQWNVNTIFSAELFPTVVRSIAFSSATSMGQISAIIASYIPELASIHKSLPVIIFSACGFICAIALSFLPETVNREILFDTIEQAEESNSSSRGFFGTLLVPKDRHGYENL